MLDPKLITFLKLVETNSYTKTAEALFITQPAVTHHVKLLEKNYNIKLFTSSNKNFSLTKQGELLYKYASQLQAFDNEFERLLTISDNKVEHYYFASTPSVLNSYLKDILPEWMSRNNKNEFNLVCEPFNKITEDLSSGSIDFALVDNNFNKRNYGNKPIYKTKIVVGFAPNSKYASQKRIDFDSLSNERVLFNQNDTGKYDFIEKELRSKNRSLKDLKSISYVNDYQTIMKIVKNGGGVGLFYESEILDELKNGNMVSCDLTEVKGQIDFYLIYNKNHLAEEKILHLATEFDLIQKEMNYLKYTRNFTDKDE